MDREERNKKFEEYLHATPAERRKFDLSFLNEPSLPEELNEELKKAAEEYAKLDEEGKWKDGGKYKGFIAGAKWQAEKGARDMYMSDNRHFEKVYQLGRTDMREQMLKEAVEGEFTKDNCGNNVVRAGVFNKDFEYGDKVRVIIVKEDEK